MNLVDDAIYDALAANSDLVALVSDRIYFGIAPEGTALPYVVFQLIDAETVTETPIDDWNGLYLVKCWSETSTAQAETMAGYVETALHKSTLTVTGWTNYWTAVGKNMRSLELETASGRLEWVAGRYVRIRLSK